MRRMIVGLCYIGGLNLWLAAGSSPVHAQDAFCLYQGILVSRQWDWCIANGRSTIAHSQLTSPSPADSGKALQLLLAGAGFDPGPIDGVPGPQTLAALRDFQRRSGLAVTGQVEPTVIAKLVSAAQERTKASTAASSSGASSVEQDQAERNAMSRAAARPIASVLEHSRSALSGLALLVIGLVIWVVHLFRKKAD